MIVHVKRLRTEQAIALEPELHKMSDQVRESATLCASMGLPVEFEGIEEDPTHIPTTEGELQLTSLAYCDLEDMFTLISCPQWSRSTQRLLCLCWFHPVRSLLCIQSSRPIPFPPPLPRSASPSTLPQLVPSAPRLLL